MTKIKRIQPLEYQSIKLLNMPLKDEGAHIKTLACENKFKITICDCNKNVELHGFLFDKKEIENAFYKINTLINELSNFKNAIFDNLEELKNQAIVDRKNKKT